MLLGSPFEPTLPFEPVDPIVGDDPDVVDDEFDGECVRSGPEVAPPDVGAIGGFFSVMAE